VYYWHGTYDWNDILCEKLEENMSIIVPDDIEFPAKVKIIVIMNDKEESVHFWLKGKM